MNDSSAIPKREPLTEAQSSIIDKYFSLSKERKNKGHEPTFLAARPNGEFLMFFRNGHIEDTGHFLKECYVINGSGGGKNPSN